MPKCRHEIMQKLLVKANTNLYVMTWNIYGFAKFPLSKKKAKRR